MSANKAELNDYLQAPFFKVAPGGHADLVAWAGGAEQQELLFWSLTRAVGERIDYLFKEYVDKKDDRIVWRRVKGGIFFKDLEVVVQSDHEFFFHDCGFQLCVGEAEREDYFAYDEHGIFWIYSKDKRYRAALLTVGLRERDAPLICDSPHWHVGVRQTEERLEKFVGVLIEHSQFAERENTAGGSQ